MSAKVWMCVVRSHNSVCKIALKFDRLSSTGKASEELSIKFEKAWRGFWRLARYWMTS